MQGSVLRIKRKRGNAWTAVVDLPRRENGGRRQKRRTFPTKREADAWLTELNHANEEVGGVGEVTARNVFALRSMACRLPYGVCRAALSQLSCNAPRIAPRGQYNLSSSTESVGNVPTTDPENFDRLYAFASAAFLKLESRAVTVSL